MIRKMQASDWSRVAEIYKQGLLEGNSTFNTVCPTFEEWDRGHIKECRFVAVKGESVVGWIAISPTSGRCVYHGSVEVSIYIDQKDRGQGIGTALLNKLVEDSEKAGYWSLYAAIFSKNKQSINLHKKCGFREIGYRERIAKDRFGEWQNVTLMERRNGIV